MREQLARAFRAQVVRDFLDAVDAVAESERRDHPDGGFDVRAVVRVEGGSLRLEMLIDDPGRRDAVVRAVDPAAPARAMAWELMHYGPDFTRLFNMLDAAPAPAADDDGPPYDDGYDYTPDDDPAADYVPNPVGWYP